MSMLNNVVGYWAYIRGTYIWEAYIRVGLYSGGGGLIFGMRWAFVYVVGLYSGGLIVGGLRYLIFRHFQHA
jgi:hypothetical protein